jgi:hypothetical protein
VFEQNKINNLRQRLVAIHGSDLIFADGYDSSIIGATLGMGPPRVVYDIEEMVETCMKDSDISEESAWEWLEYNTLSAYVGENTPIYIERFWS